MSEADFIYSPGRVFDAIAGVGLSISRSEAQVWQAKWLLHIPPANPGVGGARRYGLANAYEFALFKYLVDDGAINVSHMAASDIIRIEIEKALTVTGIAEIAALNDAQNLVGTFFDSSTHPAPFIGKPDPAKRRSNYWYISVNSEGLLTVSSSWWGPPQENFGEVQHSMHLANPAHLLDKILVVDVGYLIREVTLQLTGVYDPLSGRASNQAKK